jgi:cbb3-type cytochrome oxidase maturation protein
MNILVMMIAISLWLAFIFLIGFILNVAGGQLDDLETPANRMLDDETETQDEPITQQL